MKVQERRETRRVNPIKENDQINPLLVDYRVCQGFRLMKQDDYF